MTAVATLTVELRRLRSAAARRGGSIPARVFDVKRRGRVVLSVSADAVREVRRAGGYFSSRDALVLVPRGLERWARLVGSRSRITEAELDRLVDRLGPRHAAPVVEATPRLRNERAAGERLAAAAAKEKTEKKAAVGGGGAAPNPGQAGTVEKAPCADAPAGSATPGGRDGSHDASLGPSTASEAGSRDREDRSRDARSSARPGEAAEPERPRGTATQRDTAERTGRRRGGEDVAPRKRKARRGRRGGRRRKPAAEAPVRPRADAAKEGGGASNRASGPASTCRGLHVDGGDHLTVDVRALLGRRARGRAARLRRSLERLVKRLDVGAIGDASPRLDAARLVRELATRRCRLGAARRREVCKRYVVLAVDVSGSCASYCDGFATAALQVAAGHERVVLVLHSNGGVEEVHGQPEAVRALRVDTAAASLRGDWGWWTRHAARLGAVLALGDADAERQYRACAEAGARVVWLDPFAAAQAPAPYRVRSTTWCEHVRAVSATGGSTDGIERALRLLGA